MRFYLSILFVLLMGSCQQSGSGRSDDPIGGEEKILDSFKCVKHIASTNKDGEDDEVRGFDLTLTGFIFEKGSRAFTLEEIYTFKDKTTYTETVSRVFSQADSKDTLESDLLVVKIFTQSKEAVVYKKYDLSDSFDMECN